MKPAAFGDSNIPLLVSQYMCATADWPGNIGNVLYPVLKEAIPLSTQ